MDCEFRRRRNRESIDDAFCQRGVRNIEWSCNGFGMLIQYLYNIALHILFFRKNIMLSVHLPQINASTGLLVPSFIWYSV